MSRLFNKWLLVGFVLGFLSCIIAQRVEASGTNSEPYEQDTWLQEEMSRDQWLEQELRSEQARQFIDERAQPSLFPVEVQAARNNDYPIVLVHGFGGWGREEMLGFRYWGGLTDIEQNLTDFGYTVHTAAIGPVSSSWDRACELYAQIKGGTVDYGEAHSKLHGHSRYGRTHPGFYPEWGTIDPATGHPKRVHLIAHSLGGQTVRLLTQLLAHGHEGERAASAASDLSPLFNGGSNMWVRSIFTIAAPHDGTTMTHLVGGIVPHAQQIIGLAAAALGSVSKPVIDFKLDQWGLRREPGEPFERYSQRVYNSSIWKSSQDTSEWDLSPHGAKELNNWVQAQPEVYYFSIAAEQTFTGPLTGHELPEPFMNPLFLPSTLFMGRYENGQLDSAWWQNDGIVNTVSMDGPKHGSSDKIVAFNEIPQAGVWNYVGLMNSHDHADMIGIGVRNMKDWYVGVARLLGSLPK
ncbi:esterase/lipase family protein [Paenibacillus sp. 481]|uniref:esterase/lipase family protein n=1 Tax=Paenibacillus sp. 481 TaxID=2835869 RepID=UPI001E3521B6|nr:lipase [Paenibacillus sp. 481]UHA74891.1 lipase [Paenibacillus sp. 481]